VAGTGGALLATLDYLNLEPRYVDGTTVGGASFVAHVHHAATAIAERRCRVALITYGSTARSQGVAVGTRGRAAGEYLDQFEAVHGPTTVALYALVAQRHMHAYGTTPEQLAAIAVACRRHAGLNPDALYRDPITVADVLASPVIASPLHLLDCCVITDGGGAVVLVHPELARDLRKPPVAVLGAAEAVAHTAAGRRDYLVSAAARTGPRAFAEAGVTHADVDMAMIYDSFTITVLMTLEDLGFCPKGQGGWFAEGGRLELGGDLPINTDGGGLSSNHPGMRGIFLVIEAVRQLRGEAGRRQVADCRIALVHGTGGALGTRHSGATLLLGRA
jgi:acetyl-CoA C-acetyltransferase